jgi:CubicO group peptidase (beta-lactamase class C family)
MTDRGYLTARIDVNGGPESHADHARVPWWSFTKTALAVAALQLVGRGHFRLDERINSHPFTLRQLLQHRAGVPNYGGLASYHEAVRRGEKPWEIGQLLDRVAADRLDFDPGRGWRYSNVGYLFVRQLIEEAVGRNIGRALRYLIFDGLGLESVSVATSAHDLADTAWGNNTGYDPGWVYHGLLIGTPGDAVRFLHSLMSGHVLPRELLTEMTTRYPIGEQSLPGRPWETTGYGDGRPWTADGFRASFFKARDAAGIDGVTFNDLRGTAVTRLALVGCTEPQIVAITGHTMSDVRSILDAHYLHRDPELARNAIHKLELKYAKKSG